MTNIEIGNMTLGAAACCYSKDALDCIEFGQVSSYVTKIKWVTPAGDLTEASEADSPDLLRLARSSCGLADDRAFLVQPEKGGPAASGQPARGALNQPMFIDQFFDDEGDGALLHARNPSQIGARDGLARANEIEHNSPIDPANDLVGSSLDPL
jgi:hypothetical protein